MITMDDKDKIIQNNEEIIGIQRNQIECLKRQRDLLEQMLVSETELEIEDLRP